MTLAQMEKEARLVELWAKLSASEKLVAYGVVGVVVGWIAGLILGAASVCATYLNQQVCAGSVNYFNYSNAGLFAILALVLGIATGVVLFLKISPDMKITWPMPVAQILLGAAVATLVCAALMVLIQVTGPSGAPVLMYVADVLMVGGGALMSWGAYQGFTAKAA
jgi:hypothetical protein